VSKSFEYISEAERAYAGGVRLWSASQVPRPFRTDAYEAFFDNGGVPRHEAEAYDLFSDPTYSKVQRINETARRAGCVAVIGERAITDIASMVPDGAIIPGVRESPQEVRRDSLLRLADYIKDGEHIHILPAFADHRMMHPNYFVVATDGDGNQLLTVQTPEGSLAYEGPVVETFNYKLDHAIGLALPPDEALTLLYRAAEQV
jgi:hypothetical protein